MNLDKKAASVTEGELSEVQSQLGASALKLLLEELQYDEKCLQVHLAKLQNFTVRTMHQRTEWQKKRQERAREAVSKWWDTKAWTAPIIYIYIYIYIYVYIYIYMYIYIYIIYI